MNQYNLLTTHRFYSPILVTRQLFNAKSLWRSLLNLACQNQTLSGKILDIGGKEGHSSYYQYLNISPESEIICTDILAGDKVVYLDVEKEFPFIDNSLDYILAFNLFEHIFAYDLASKEVFRTLRQGGKILLATPFLFPYHADPDDYFRYTDSAILRIWTEAGFECTHLEAIGEGIVTNFSTTLLNIMMPKSIRGFMSSLLYLMTTPLDRLIAKIRSRVNGKSVAERYPLGYFAIFIKP
jgi:SAM-dependent methyltransferase